MTTEPPAGRSGALRALWQGRLDEARTAYEQAVAQMEVVLSQDDSAKGKPDLALTQRAFFKEAEARDEYVRVLKIYADLVVHGIQPAE